MATIISIGVIVHLFALWIISTNYDHDDEVRVEYAQHCVSTVVIFIDTICLYLSCRLSKQIYEKFCKYPHKCCTFLCDKTIDIKEQIRIAMNPDENEMTEIVVPRVTSQSSVSPSAVSPPVTPDVDETNQDNNVYEANQDNNVDETNQNNNVEEVP